MILMFPESQCIDLFLNLHFPLTSRQGFGKGFFLFHWLKNFIVLKEHFRFMRLNPGPESRFVFQSSVIYERMFMYFQDSS